MTRCAALAWLALCGTALAAPPAALSGPPASSGTTASSVIASNTVSYGVPAGVPVPANKSAPLIGVNAARRVLIIRPAPTGSPCFMDPSGGVSSAASLPIPDGFIFDAATLPPKSGVTVFCLQAWTIIVTEGN